MTITRVKIIMREQVVPENPMLLIHKFLFKTSNNNNNNKFNKINYRMY